jgi:DNA-binding MarR family transcriptional regulator
MVKDALMGVNHSTSRSAVRLALVTNPPPAAPDTPTGVPAGLRLLRSLDRSVLEIAREVDLRPMELYALLLLSDCPDEEAVSTRMLADLLAASPSQAKQIALRLAARGYAHRGGSQGRTRLTDEGRRLARRASDALEDEMARRLGDIDRNAVVLGAATLSALAAG